MPESHERVRAEASLNLGHEKVKQLIIQRMVPLLDNHHGQIIRLCRKYGVRKLELFGSAARGDFDPAQ